jgi:hypothetical protein
MINGLRSISNGQMINFVLPSIKWFRKTWIFASLFLRTVINIFIQVIFSNIITYYLIELLGVLLNKKERRKSVISWWRNLKSFINFHLIWVWFLNKVFKYLKNEKIIFIKVILKLKCCKSPNSAEVIGIFPEAVRNCIIFRFPAKNTKEQEKIPYVYIPFVAYFMLILNIYMSYM